MEENCQDCMKWEEKLYWTHFQTLHFSQLLLPGFHNRLAIPKKFSTHCKRKLVTLKSPSGASYTVKVDEDDEKTLSFTSGWDKFVKDHSLQENDLLVFKFHGGGASEFEVLVFDSDTFCEKPTSYFVKKCRHADTKKGKRSINLNDIDATLNQQPVMSPLGYKFKDLVDVDIDIDTLLNPDLGHEQEGHINIDIGTETGQQLPVISPTSTAKVSEGKYSLSGFKKIRGETSNDDLDSKAEVIAADNNRKALSLAKRAISSNGFLVVMSRSHVTTKYYLTIPSRWCMKNMLLQRQDVVMQMDSKKWVMKFSYYESCGIGGISIGWKKFVHDNNLREGDVCVFEPVNTETKPLRLDVYIFRATEAESSNNG